MEYLRQNGDLISAPFGENVIVRGQLVTVDASGNAIAGETGQKAFLGVADENSADMLNDRVRIYAEGAFLLEKDSAVATDLGKDVAIASPTKVTTTTTSATVVGKIVEIVDGSHVFVKLK